MGDWGGVVLCNHDDWLGAGRFDRAQVQFDGPALVNAVSSGQVARRASLPVRSILHRRLAGVMGGHGDGAGYTFHSGLLEHTTVDARARSTRISQLDCCLVVHAGRVVEHARRLSGWCRHSWALHHRALGLGVAYGTLVRKCMSIGAAFDCYWSR